MRTTSVVARKLSHRVLSVLLALLSLNLFVSTPAPAAAIEKDALQDLWIDLSLGPPLVDLFNARAQAQDIARVEHISQLELLEDVTAGKKLVVFKSAQDAIRLLPHIHDELDIVGYNLEHGPTNPQPEQEDPVGSIEALKEVVDLYDLELALGPDRRFAESHGVQMAPYADYFILQVQKVQTEPETVYDFVVPLVKRVRKANPDIQVSVQIRTEGDVEDLLDLLEPLEDDLDGISILTSVDTVDVAEELVGELRDVVITPTPVPTSTEISIAAAPEDGTPAATAALPPLAERSAGTNSTGSVAALEPTTAAVVRAAEEAAAADRAQEPLSAPESQKRSGSTWLIAFIALTVGFAAGAGYYSHRTSGDR